MRDLKKKLNKKIKKSNVSKMRTDDIKEKFNVSRMQMDVKREKLKV